jgi:PhnB protein
MASVNIYLNFAGNCEEAFLFYQSVFGGEIPYVGRFKDMPPQEGQPPLPKEMEDKIMHISLRIGADSVIMGSDTGGEWASSFSQGNNFALSVNTESTGEADRIFNGLSAGGTVTMPLTTTFWGSYFGMLTDRFGIGWMVSFEQPKEK